MPFSEQCWHRFIETIKENDVTRKQSPGARTFPDWLVTSIEYSLILKLLGFDVDLSALKPYEEYSEHLKFVLDPDSFDYTLVDTANYMWQNLIYSKYYKHCFIDHKDEILNEDLRHIFKLGLETEDQRKIVYGVLLNSDELLRF